MIKKLGFNSRQQQMICSLLHSSQSRYVALSIVYQRLFSQA